MRPDLDSAIDMHFRDVDDLVVGSEEVVREQHFGDDVVVAVTYRRRKKDDVRRSCFGIAWSERWGWQTAGGAWSSSIVERPPRGIWLDYGGWGPGPDVLAGWLADPAAASLHVTDGLGRTIDDDVENGVAILHWDGDFSSENATVELRDAAGRVLTREPLRPRREH
jgi:hypothetical protein